MGSSQSKCLKTGFALQPAAHSLGQIELSSKVYCKEEKLLLTTQNFFSLINFAHYFGIRRHICRFLLMKSNRRKYLPVEFLMCSLFFIVFRIENFLTNLTVVSVFL